MVAAIHPADAVPLRLLDLVTPEAMLDTLAAEDKTDALTALARRAAAQTGADGEALADALMARERLSSTGIGGGIAIPHAPVDGVSSVRGFLARFEPSIEFEAIDELPVDLAFLALLPRDGSAEALKALAAIARALRSRTLSRSLRAASDAAGMYAALADWQRAEADV